MDHADPRLEALRLQHLARKQEQAAIDTARAALRAADRAVAQLSGGLDWEALKHAEAAQASLEAAVRRLERLAARRRRPARR